MTYKSLISKLEQARTPQQRSEFMAMYNIWLETATWDQIRKVSKYVFKSIDESLTRITIMCDRIESEASYA